MHTTPRPRRLARPSRLLLALLVAPWSTAAAQTAPAPLSLAEALRLADRGAYANRVADARLRGARAARALTGRGFLPGVRAEAGWTRSNDPLAAFGFLLRQQAVTAADFDPARLNAPAPRSLVNAGVVLEQPLLHPETWAARRAAGLAAAATAAEGTWTRATARLATAEAWAQGVLAAEAVVALDAALRSARQHVRQATSLARNGMVTHSDVLLAEVRAGEVESRLLGARDDADLAARRVRLLLGDPDTVGVRLPDSLPPAGVLEAMLATELAAARTDGDERADLAAARLAAQAARAGVARAGAALLPRLGGVARYDWYSARALGGGPGVWTVGIQATWSPFSGGSELAQRRLAASEAQAAATRVEAAAAEARLELAQAESAARLAAAQLAIATRAVVQAREAHRIVARKYEGGLATVVELFDALAAETGARVAEAERRSALLLALARRRHALGLSLDSLAEQIP